MKNYAFSSKHHEKGGGTARYLGSFWDQPLDCTEQRALFEKEENDLYTDLSQLPRMSAVGARGRLQVLFSS